MLGVLPNAMKIPVSGYENSKGYAMNKTILLLTSTFVFYVSGSLTLAGELSPDTEAIIDAVIQAHEAQTSAIRKGTGLANVSVLNKFSEHKPEEENYRARFWFKDQSSRTDTSLLDSQASGDDIYVSKADNGEFSYRYSCFRDSVRVRRTGVGFRGDLGNDFHPDIYFNGGMPKPISYGFKRLKDNLISEPELRFTQNGLLEFTISSSKKRKYDNQVVADLETHYILLDPEGEYRLLEYRFEQNNFSGPGSSFLSHMKIEWSDSGLEEAYPKSVSFDRVTVRSAQELKNVSDGEKLDRKVETHITINVEEFTPNVEIDDKLFTLAGMGIERGAIVNDVVSGIIYRYDSPKVTEISLESLLSESHSELSPSKTNLTREEDSSSNEKRGLDNMATEDAVSSSGVAASIANSNLRIVVAISIVVVIASMTVLLIRLIARRKRKYG
ncbi:MAG: hypothetical protein FVQ84_19760 [Planctomycetes bacterium]|nr:hypothetical protein [Planctomycetota bacterium]